MAVSATVKAGVFNLVLPDGNRYQAGDVAILTDAEWAQVSAADVTAFLTGAAPLTPGAGVTSDTEPNSPTAVASAGGAAVIGGVIGTAWNKVAAVNAPAYVRDQNDECSSGRSGMIAGGGFGTDAVDTTYTTPAPASSNV
jgi:hypothetical protein